MPDDVYGKYRLVKRIASGGMAEVFKAVAVGEAGFEKPVAIKRLHRHMSEDGDLVAMLQDEARLCSRLNHGNICQVLDLGRVADTYYIAMEFVDGKDLFHILRTASRRERPLPLAAALHIACEMLAGLDYAHRKRDPEGRLLHIIHRDISPQNVLVTWDGEVKIIDFGIAKARTSTHRTQAGVIKGKFRYMSPEQARGEPIDHRTDIFAAAVVLYEMISGQPHSVNATDREILIKIQTGQFDRLRSLVPDLAPELEELVHRALTVNPDHRYASARSFRKALLTYTRQAGLTFAKDDLADYVRWLFEEEQAAPTLDPGPPPRPAPAATPQGAFDGPEADPFSVRARLPVAPIQPTPTIAIGPETTPQPTPRRGRRASRQKPTIALDTPRAKAAGRRPPPPDVYDSPPDPTARVTPPRPAPDEAPAAARPRHPQAPAPSAPKPAKAKGSQRAAHKRLGALFGALLRAMLGLALLAALGVGGYEVYRVLGPRFGLVGGAAKTSPGATRRRRRVDRQVKASFTFDSRPRGARIFLNGQDIEQKTPAKLQLTVPSRLLVELRHRRFKTPWKRILPVANGDQVVLIADLRNPPSTPGAPRRRSRWRPRTRWGRAPRRPRTENRKRSDPNALVPDIADEAKLYVTCDAKGARVLINGIDRGTTPLSKRVRPTTFTVQVRTGSRRSDKRAVTLKPGEIRRMHFQLGP